MESAEGDAVLAEAAALIDALARLAIEYQFYVRSPAAPLNGDETNLEARIRVSREYDKLEPRGTVRKLEMAGYDRAAEALEELRKAVFDVVGWLEMSWDPDESCVLDIDVAAMRNKAHRELGTGRAVGSGAQDGGATADDGQRIALLTEAALLADTLQSLGLDYQSCLDGCIPIPIDEDESDQDRMRRVASEYDQLAPNAVVDNLLKQGLRQAAAALDDLSKEVDQIVHNKDTKPSVNNAEILEIEINDKHKKTIDQLKHDRLRAKA